MRQVSLRLVVEDVLGLTRATARPEVQLQNMVPVNLTVFGDTGRIIQIMNNLTGNSAKFTRKGFIRVVARGTGNGMVAISVLDTGIGIPKTHLSSVFQPFEQVDMSISRKYGGFGLGLHIAQDLVRAHGGDIYVTSQEGQGSCFTFTLPAADDRTDALGRPIAFDPMPAPSPRPSNLVLPPEESACARCLPPPAPRRHCRRRCPISAQSTTEQRTTDPISPPSTQNPQTTTTRSSCRLWPTPGKWTTAR